MKSLLYSQPFTYHLVYFGEMEFHLDLIEGVIKVVLIDFLLKRDLDCPRLHRSYQ